MRVPHLIGWRHGKPVWEIAGGTNTFGITARAYRWYADGTESGMVALAAENASYDLDLSGGDAPIILRYGVQESGTGSASGVSTDDYQLQYSLNGGAFTNVTAASTVVQGFASGNLTDAGATTQLMSSGTGSFVAGEISEDGLLDNWQLTANNFSELVYAIDVIKADVADNDTITFRVLRNGGVFNTYTVTPTLTVNEPPPPTDGEAQAISQIDTQQIAGMFDWFPFNYETANDTAIDISPLGSDDINLFPPPPESDPAILLPSDPGSNWSDPIASLFDWAPFDYGFQEPAVDSDIASALAPNFTASENFEAVIPNTALTASNTAFSSSSNPSGSSKTATNDMFVTSVAAAYTVQATAGRNNLNNWDPGLTPQNRYWLNFDFALSEIPSAGFLTILGFDLTGSPFLVVKADGSLALRSGAADLDITAAGVIQPEKWYRIEAKYERLGGSSIITAAVDFYDPADSASPADSLQAQLVVGGSSDVTAIGPELNNIDATLAGGPSTLWLDEIQFSTIERPTPTLTTPAAGQRPTLINAEHHFDQQQVAALFEWDPFWYAELDPATTLDVTPQQFPPVAGDAIIDAPMAEATADAFEAEIVLISDAEVQAAMGLTDGADANMPAYFIHWSEDPQEARGGRNMHVFHPPHPESPLIAYNPQVSQVILEVSGVTPTLERRVSQVILEVSGPLMPWAAMVSLPSHAAELFDWAPFYYESHESATDTAFAFGLSVQIDAPMATATARASNMRRFLSVAGFTPVATYSNADVISPTFVVGGNVISSSWQRPVIWTDYDTPVELDQNAPNDDAFVQGLIAPDGSTSAGQADVGSISHAARWNGTTLTVLDNPNDYAYGLDSDVYGNVVGSGEDGAGGSVAIYWAAGGTAATILNDLGAPGDFTEAFAINGHGIIGGYSNYGAGGDAVYWTSPTASPTSLGTLPGGTGGTVLGISENDVMVGQADDAGANLLAVRWNGLTAVQLEEIGDSNSQASGVSDDGTIIVGRALKDGVYRPVRWDNDIATILESDDATVGEAKDVNDSGHIVGKVTVGGSPWAVVWENPYVVTTAPDFSDAATPSHYTDIAGQYDWSNGYDIASLDPATTLDITAYHFQVAPDAIITAPMAEATADATAPTLKLDAVVTAPIATATADAIAPTFANQAIVSAPTAEAYGDALMYWSPWADRWSDSGTSPIVNPATFPRFRALRGAIAVTNTVIGGVPNVPSMTYTGVTFTQLATWLVGDTRVTIFNYDNPSAPNTDTLTTDFAGQTQDDVQWWSFYSLQEFAIDKTPNMAALMGDMTVVDLMTAVGTGDLTWATPTQATPGTNVMEFIAIHDPDGSGNGTEPDPDTGSLTYWQQWAGPSTGIYSWDTQYVPPWPTTYSYPAVAEFFQNGTMAVRGVVLAFQGGGIDVIVRIDALHPLFQGEDQNQLHTFDWSGEFHQEYATTLDVTPAFAAAVDATITAPIATASADATAPTLKLDAIITGEMATATADALAPAIASTVTAPMATATADGIAPTLKLDAVITSPIATATADATAPTLELGSTATSPIATATADAIAPTLKVDVVLTAPMATATGDAVAPAIVTQAILDAPSATATADANAPATAGTAYAPMATATADAVAPTIQTQAIITGEMATASADAMEPSVIVEIPSLHPLFQGEDPNQVHLQFEWWLHDVAALDPATSIDTSYASRVLDAEMATATADAVAPTIVTGAQIDAPTATATADAPAPSSAGSITIDAPLALAAADAIAPTLKLDAVVTGVMATASADANAPEFKVDQILSAPSATATADGVAPTLKLDTVQAAPMATATADVVAPTLALGAQIDAPTATATGDAVAPTVVLGALINAPTATATGDGIAPTLKVDIILAAPTATATSSADAPTLKLDAIIGGVTAEATADAMAPSTAGNLNIDAPMALATATANAPVLKVDAIVSGELATAAASANAPAVAISATITAPMATATGDAVAPTLVRDWIFAAPMATATAVALTPSPAGGITIDVGTADATADANAPAVVLGALVNAPMATASGTATAPTLVYDMVLVAPQATAAAAALVPLVQTVETTYIFPDPAEATADADTPAVQTITTLYAPIATARAFAKIAGVNGDPVLFPYLPARSQPGIELEGEFIAEIDKTGTHNPEIEGTATHHPGVPSG